MDDYQKNYDLLKRLYKLMKDNLKTKFGMLVVVVFSIDNIIRPNNTILNINCGNRVKTQSKISFYFLNHLVHY